MKSITRTNSSVSEYFDWTGEDIGRSEFRDSRWEWRWGCDESYKCLSGTDPRTGIGCTRQVIKLTEDAFTTNLESMTVDSTSIKAK